MKSKDLYMAALLVAGTSIGAGMLALPVVTGLSGFLPAMLVNTLCWLFMLATGLLFLEAVLWMEPGTNLLSMADRFLGKWGRFSGGIAFLFLYYCLMVSYIAGGAPLLFGVKALWSYLAFGALLGGVVFLGEKKLNRVNWILMWSLILSYFLLIGLGSADVELSNLARASWGLTFVSAPLLFSAYGYHNVVPSIAMHLRQNGPKLRRAIIIGTFIPFAVYSLWQWMFIGSLNLDQLKAVADSGAPITEALKQSFEHPYVAKVGAFFGLFALVTSVLGVSLSMVDFFADGFSLSRVGLSRAFLTMIVFLPPALFASYRPDIFVSALSLAGGFGESILNGLFPVLMVWVGRYKFKLKSDYSLFGGKAMLSLLLLITFAIIALEYYELMH